MDEDLNGDAVGIETTPLAHVCPPKKDYDLFLYAFIALFVYSAILLLGIAILLIVYRQYLRFMFRKKPVYKPGMTMDETVTTMGTVTQTEVSVMGPPSKVDKHEKTEETTPNGKQSPKTKSKEKKK